MSECRYDRYAKQRLASNKATTRTMRDEEIAKLDWGWHVGLFPPSPSVLIDPTAPPEPGTAGRKSAKRLLATFSPPVPCIRPGVEGRRILREALAAALAPERPGRPSPITGVADPWNLVDPMRWVAPAIIGAHEAMTPVFGSDGSVVDWSVDVDRMKQSLEFLRTARNEIAPRLDFRTKALNAMLHLIQICLREELSPSENHHPGLEIPR